MGWQGWMTIGLGVWCGSILGWLPLATAQQQTPPPQQPNISPTPKTTHPTPQANTPQIRVEGGEHEVYLSTEGLQPLTHAFSTGTKFTISQHRLARARARGETLADLLQQAPGVSVVRQGGALGRVYVRIRGLRAEHTLVLLNGVPLSVSPSRASALRAQGLGGVDLSAISLDRVAAIEIVRGASSALYGQGAVAGVINIRTHPPKHSSFWGESGAGTGGLRMLALGQYGGARPAVKTRLHNPRLQNPRQLPTNPGSGPAMLDASTDLLNPAPPPTNPPNNNWDWALRSTQTQGRYVFFDPLRASGGVLENTPCARALGSGFYERHCNAKKNLHFQAGWQTPLLAVSPNLNPTSHTIRNPQSNRVTKPLSASSHPPLAHLRIEGQIGQQERFGLGGVADPQPFGYQLERRFGLRIQRIPNHAAILPPMAEIPSTNPANPANTSPSPPTPTWQLGWQAHIQALHTTRNQNTQINAPNLRSRFKNAHYGGAINGTRQHAALTLRLGSHIQRYTLRQPQLKASQTQNALFLHLQHQTPTHKLEAALRGEKVSGYTQKTTYSLAINRLYAHGISTKASLGSAWRAPALHETHALPNDTTTLANPNLRIETSRSASVGVIKDALAWQMEVLGFRQVVQNEISAVARSDAPSVFRYQNLTTTQTRGLEVFVETQFWKAWQLSLSTTRQKPIVLHTQDARQHKNQKPGAPRSESRLTLGYHNPRLLAQITGLMRAKRYVDLANTRQLPAYHTVNLHTALALNSHFQMRLQINNLTNQLYSEVDNQPHPERQWQFSIRFVF